MSERYMEYSRDRLEAEIKRLELKIIDIQLEHDAERGRNELYHSASARLVASEYIRCHLEDDYP